jgi:hypothetical protein
MKRVSRAAPHLSVEAVQQKLQSARSYWHGQKWLIVYNGLVDPRPAAEIAKQTGVSVATVHKVISQYNQIENIRLLPQPSHSPELMPVEHIWEDIRENYFYNRILKSMDKVVDTLCQSLIELSSAPERLRSLTYFPHLRISC